MAAPDAAAPRLEMAGTSQSGTLGVRRVSAARNRGAGTLNLVLEGGYGSASSLLVASDTAQLQGQSVRVNYALHEHWDLMLGEATKSTSDSDYYASAATTWTQFYLQGAYHHPLVDTWSLGGALTLNLPAQISGFGVALAGLGGEAELRTSWRVHPLVDTSFNLGMALDRSEYVLSTPLSRMQRLALGASHGLHGSWGIGADAWLPGGGPVAWGGLLELSGQWAPQGRAGDMPIILSLGARLVPRTLAWIEVALGVDVRLLGAPTPTDYYAGVLPWYVFAQVAVHLAPFFVHDAQTLPEAPRPAPRPAPGPAKGTQDVFISAQAPGSAAALPPDSNAVVNEDLKATAQRVVISGSVLTPRGRPAVNAQVTLEGHEDVRFATDQNTGRFHTLPVACDANAIEVTATTPRGSRATTSVPCHESQKQDVALVVRPPPPAPGLVVIIVTGKQWEAAQTGSLTCPGLPGSPFALHQGEPVTLELLPRLLSCTIAAPGSKPQTHTFQVRARQTTVFNIELAPLERSRAHPSPAKDPNAP